jgi:signal transduction histidine kinase
MAADVDVPALIEEVLMVYDSRLRASGIELRREFSIVPAVHALRGELHQVFSNLVSNAIDAMRDGGTLNVTVREGSGSAGAGVEVGIEDTGVGIPAQNLPRLEPFFTTKTSAGTGLGLWVVQQFLESWGGTVSVASNSGSPEHGTRFTIFLPLNSIPAKRPKTNGTSSGLASKGTL